MNISENIYEGIAVVMMHLNGEYTKILLKKTLGIGLADGGISWDIPTNQIPYRMRNIGSHLYLEMNRENGFVFKEI